jgi:hypothetical protein
MTNADKILLRNKLVDRDRTNNAVAKSNWDDPNADSLLRLAMLSTYQQQPERQAFNHAKLYIRSYYNGN